MKNFVEELKWRGMLAQIMPGTEEFLQKNMVSAYLGTDPLWNHDVTPFTALWTQAILAHWWCNRYDWRPIRQESRA